MLLLPSFCCCCCCCFPSSCCSCSFWNWRWWFCCCLIFFLKLLLKRTVAQWFTQYATTAGEIQLCVFNHGFKRLYILNDLTKCHDSANIFSNAVQVFRNLPWKRFPILGKILIMCLKCSTACFFPSSYNEKMRWRRGCSI